VSAVAEATKLSRQCIDRIRDDAAWAETIIAKWTEKRRDAAWRVEVGATAHHAVSSALATFVV
jgi:hypothetical protein